MYVGQLSWSSSSPYPGSRLTHRDIAQGRLLSHYHQQSRRIDLPARIPARVKQTLHERLPRSRGDISRVFQNSTSEEEKEKKKKANMYLKHPSVHAITRSLTPKLPSAPTTALATSGTSTPTPAGPAAYSYPNPGLPPSGLEVLETDKFRLTCFQTLTGTKFLLFTDPLMTNVDAVIKKIYELFADYVLKNPFYQLEMPVRCEAFDRHLVGWLRGRA